MADNSDSVAEAAAEIAPQQNSTDAEVKPEPVSSEATSTEEKKATPERLAASGKNIKFDASLLPESSDPKEIRKQVEFYFSDSNLPYDKFLYSLVTKENKPVPIKLIASFKRMRRFKDQALIVSAVHESEILDVAGEPGDETVVRKEALPLGEAAAQAPVSDGKPAADGIRKITDRTLKRSMYAKGFGDETPTTQIDVEKLVEPFGPINAVRLRRDDNGVFKGSVFVEFATEELQAAFATLGEKPSFNGSALQWETKEHYVERKAEDIRAGRIKPSARKFNNKKFNAYQEEKRAGAEQKKQSEKGHGARGGRGGQRGGRGRGRGGHGGRGGRGGRRDGGNDRNAERRTRENGGVPQLKDTSSNGDAAANGNKRKAEDAAQNVETKKAKADE